MNIFQIYSIVGTTRADNFEAQRAAYREKCMVVHPDRKGGDTQQFAELNAAWSRIKTPLAQTKLLMEYRMVGVKCGECNGESVKRKTVSFTKPPIVSTCSACAGCGYVPREGA